MNKNVKRMLCAVAVISAISVMAVSAYNKAEKNTVSDNMIGITVCENKTPFSDDRLDLPITTWNGGTIKFEHKMETTSNRPYYEVWVCNSGSHTMYVDIGGSTNNIVKAGETKSFYGKTGIFSRNQDIIVTCKDGYELYGQISIKISNDSLG